jgi:hypothetical protein
MENIRDHKISNLVTQLAERVTPLRLDLSAPFDNLDPLTDRARDAEVVALGSAVRIISYDLNLS